MSEQTLSFGNYCQDDKTVVTVRNGVETRETLPPRKSADSMDFRLTLYETALRKLQNAAAAYVHPHRRISAEELIGILLATVDDRELFRALRGRPDAP